MLNTRWRSTRRAGDGATATWVEATHVARDAGVKQLVLFHHDPSHDDDFIDGLVEKARAEFPNTIAAREGESLVL